MFNNLGLGIRLNLDDNVSRRVSPVVSEIERLERAARNTSGAFTDFNDNMNRRQFRANQFQDMNRALRGTEYVLADVTNRFNRATQSAQMFANATGRIQVTQGFNRMLGDITRAQRQIANLGFGMSKMQKQMSDTRAYNMINYQMKELTDRIALTRKGLEQMQKAPDSSKFVREINESRNALKLYETQLSRINAQQVLARANGQKVASIGGSDTLLDMPKSYFTQAKNKLVGMSMVDMGVMAQSSYNSINKTAKMMVGLGYTTMETRQKVTALAGSLMMVGGALSMFVTMPLGIATLAMGRFATVFEEAHNIFQARTLIPDSEMDRLNGYRDLIDQVQVNTGATHTQTSESFSIAKIINPKMDSSGVKDQAQNALFFQKVWGTDTQKSLNDVNKISQQLGVSNAKAWDMYVAGAMKAQEEGRKLGTFKGAENILETVMGSASQYKAMTSETGKFNGALGQMIENYEKGAMENIIEFFLTLGNVIKQMWYAVEDPLRKFFGVLKSGAEAIYEFTQTHKEITKFVAIALGIGATFLMLIGPALLLTGAFTMFRSVIQGVSASVFGLTKGGLAILSPQAMMAKSKMDSFTVALARLPQTLLATLPLLYNLIRGIPLLGLKMISINPLFAVITGLIGAYATNFGGFKDSVTKSVDTMKQSWKQLELIYTNSSLPAVFKSLKEHGKAFGEGVVEGFKGILDIGKVLLDTVLYPIKEVFKALKPLILDAFNGLDIMFGGDGGAKNTGDMVDKMFGTADKWKSTGVVVGKVLAGLTAFYFLSKGFGAIVTPFQKLSGVLKGMGTSLLGMGKAVPLATAGIRNSVGGAVGNARDYIAGTHGGNPVVGTQNVLRRGMSTLMTPFTATRNALANGLAGYGIGNGVAMGRERASARTQGLAMRDNPDFLRTLHANPLIGNSQSGIRNNGSYQGNQVYRSGQGVISRALTGQQMYTYNPIRDPQTGMVTGYSRNNLARTGGLLRSASSDGINPGQNRLQRGVGAVTGGLRNIGSTVGGWGSGAVGTIGNGIMTPFRATSRVIGRGFDRVTGSAPMRGLANAGNWMGGRLAQAGVRNPFAGAISPTGAMGPMTRTQMVGNFARTGVMGTGAMLASGAMMAGRGVANVGRGVATAGRVATAPLGMLGKGAGALMGLAMNPLTLAAGLASYGAYKAFGGEKKDKDGNVIQKGSVNNIAGNMDKATANIMEGGDSKITAFWDKFLKTAKPIVIATGKLIGASLLALVKALPSILRSVGAGLLTLGKFIKEGAIRGWEWAKTDGIKLLGQAWTWIKTDGVAKLGEAWDWIKVKASEAGSFMYKILGQAWEWIKTKGVVYLGQFFAWLLGTALPWALSALSTGFERAFNWVMTSGIDYLQSFFKWLIGTAIPEAVSFMWNAFKSAWGWIKDDGIALFGQLVSATVQFGLDMGSNILTGIKNALGGLGTWIKNQLPSVASIKNTLLGAGGSDSKTSTSKSVKSSTTTKRYASGGFITAPHMGIVGEAGPEVIIPLSGNQRNRALGLLESTSNMLGVNKKQTNPVSAVKQNAPVNSVKGVSQQGTSDNSITIESLTVTFPESMSGMDETATKKQALSIMKEMQKIVKQKQQVGGKAVSLDSLIMNM